MGPGPGNQLHRFDMSRVDRIYGVEPNSRYQDGINAKLQKNGLQDKYKLIVSGIEDSNVLRKEGVTEGSLDSVLSIQVLCAVRDPKAVMKEVWKLLKPGGKFIFWEHGWSRSSLTVTEQSESLIILLFLAAPHCGCLVSSDSVADLANMRKVILNPAWSTFIGCSMTRNVLGDILNAGDWENPQDIEEPEDWVSMLPRIQGVLIKKA